MQQVHYGLDLNEITKRYKKGIVFVDSYIFSTGKKIADVLNFILIEVPSGEQNKSQNTLTFLQSKLFQLNVDRTFVFIAVGGGVTLDLIGFLAATFLRGVDLVYIPTTLLAMVDASIGGKNAINTEFGKNLIGTFYYPKLTFIEISFLKTLNHLEILNGLAEILKIALTCNKDLWHLCKNDPFSHLPHIIPIAIEEKKTIVEEDFDEKKHLRKILNFGHTIAHGLEKISNYTIPHGRAVAIGCQVEAFLSNKLGFLSKQDLDEIITVFQKLQFPKLHSDITLLIEAMKNDKKNQNKKIHFVILSSIGKVETFDGEYTLGICPKILEEMLQNI